MGFECHQETPKELVISVFVLRVLRLRQWRRNQRVELRAQNEVQLLAPGTKADNHLFWREGCNLGWLAPVPLGTGVPGS